MLRIRIRDLLWLTLVVALGIAWSIDRRQLAREIDRLFTSNVEGRVIGTNEGQRLIEVSVGSDDGLRPRDLVEVSRDGQWLGRAVVRTLARDTAIAGVEASKSIIKTGDLVSLQLDRRRIPQVNATAADQVLDRRHP